MSSAAQFWVGPTIGEGAFGHVVYAIHKSSNRKVAIKVVEVPTGSQRRHQQIQREQKIAMILNERRILNLPGCRSSKWIVDIWGAFGDTEDSANSSPKFLYFVLELATGGDLMGLIHRGLRSQNRRLWQRSSVPEYISQLIAAVDFLHSQSILHCDLKPENVLLDAVHGHLMLADFGCAIDTRQLGNERREVLPRGTARYASPELLRTKPLSELTVAVDHWSVGCILHAMMHGHSPFDRGSEALTVEAILLYVSGDESSTSGEGLGSSANSHGEKHKEGGINATAVSEMGTEGHDDRLQSVSKNLLSIQPDDRISAWRTEALPFVVSQSRNDDDGGGENTDKKHGQQTVPGTRNIVLPVPDWQDQVANTRLRDGSLGWSVFQI